MSDQNLPILCPDGVDLVDAYLDGDLVGAELEQFEAHLESCESCREELRLARDVAGVFAELGGLECPPGVIERVDAERLGAASTSAGPLGGWGWARAATLFGVVAAGLLAGLIFLGDREPPAPTVAELQEAEEELRFALAYFSGIARKASLTLRDDVLSDRVLEPPRRALQRLGAPAGPSPASDEKENS